MAKSLLPEDEPREGAKAREPVNAMRLARTRASDAERAPQEEDAIARRRRQLVNAIGPAPTRGAEAPRERRAMPAARGIPQEAQARPRDERAVPEEVKRRFVQSGNVFYFHDGARAFVDRGERLTTRSENTEVIKSLIAIAQARGWDDVSLSGTQRFKKEAWYEAKLAGLTVRGHTPDAFEEARLARALARAASPPSVPAADVAAPHRGPSSQPRTARAAEHRSDEPAPPAREKRDRIISGRLLDHGPAPYQHHPQGTPSYFVKLETKHGDREVWGVDLERAFKESLSQPQIHDKVVLRTVRQEDVTVRVPELAPDGKVVAEKPLETYRNRWMIETEAFTRERAEAARTLRDPSIDASRAVQRHPELKGSYLDLRALDELMEQRQTNPENRQRLRALVREVLAKSVARGDPLEPVRLREQPSREHTRGERRREPHSSAR